MTGNVWTTSDNEICLLMNVTSIIHCIMKLYTLNLNMLLMGGENILTYNFALNCKSHRAHKCHFA